MAQRLGSVVLGAALGGITAACGLLQQGAPPDCLFPEGTALAYVGRTTLGRLELSADDPAADLAAMVFVTRDPVPFSGSLPAGARMPPDQRAYCAIFDEGAGPLSAHGNVPTDWTPPGS